jgi:hypothetical protein
MGVGRQGRRISFAATALLGALMLVARGPATAGPDDAWKERLGGEIARVEAGVAELDGQKAAEGTLLERVTALDGRIAALEKAAGLEVGKVEGKDDLAALTRDVGVLRTRWKTVERGGAPPPGPEKPAPKEPPAPEEPKPPTGPRWPETVAFSATAKMTYHETGFLAPERAAYLGVPPETPFLMDGYEGNLSFSLRAKGLVRPLKTARVRVRVRLKSPFHGDAQATREYDVDWKADRELSDGALRTWLGHDTLSVSLLPRRWIRGPRRVAADLDAEAYLLSAVTRDGTSLEFEVPEKK